MATMILNPSSIEDYRLFIRAKALPQFRCHGRMIEVPDEYAHLLAPGEAAAVRDATKCKPTKGLYDYQRDISKLAIRKRKFAIFAEPGRGKTLMMTEYIRHVIRLLPRNKRLLWIAPPMVVKQTLKMVAEWYGNKLQIERVFANNLSDWLLGRVGDCRIGITNYQALRDTTPQGELGALVLDESQMMRSAYGAWAGTCLRLGDGLEWKLCATGTPAPNDRIEFANHAVFLGAFPTVNAFLARYFINRGQTDNRWELKPHALSAFYRDLSSWCIFLTNPATYGWKDGCAPLPAVNVHIHDVDLTDEQHAAVYKVTNRLFLDSAGGIVKRAKLSRIGKGEFEGQSLPTNKDAFIKELAAGWPDESTLIWCHFNNEQAAMEKLFPGAASILGKTPEYKREEFIEDFQAGRRKQLISKPAILGLGLNLQIATRQIFSGMNDSYEQYFQAIKRSNRIGSTQDLNVHIPVTPIERPQWENVLRKAKRVQSDTEAQEREFKDKGIFQW